MSSPGYEEFVESLTRHGAKFLIGAHAVALCAQPQATKDLDILFGNESDNAVRILDTIKDFFGGAELGINVANLTEPGRVVQPVKAVINPLEGCDEVAARKSG